MNITFLIDAPKEYDEATDQWQSPGKLYVCVSTHGHWGLYWTEPAEGGYRLGPPGAEPRCLHRGPVSEIGLTYFEEDDCLYEDNLEEVMPMIAWESWLSHWWRANGQRLRRLTLQSDQENSTRNVEAEIDEDFLSALDAASEWQDPEHPEVAPASEVQSDDGDPLNPDLLYRTLRLAVQQGVLAVEIASEYPYDDEGNPITHFTTTLPVTHFTRKDGKIALGVVWDSA